MYAAVIDMNYIAESIVPIKGKHLNGKSVGLQIPGLQLCNKWMMFHITIIVMHLRFNCCLLHPVQCDDANKRNRTLSKYLGGLDSARKKALKKHEHFQP